MLVPTASPACISTVHCAVLITKPHTNAMDILNGTSSECKSLEEVSYLQLVVSMYVCPGSADGRADGRAELLPEILLTHIIDLSSLE